MNPIDSTIYFINGFANKFWALDRLVVLISWNSFFKGAVLTTIYWYLWFSNKAETDNTECRKTLLASIIGTFAGLAISITLNNILPFRIRPMHNPELHLYIQDEVRNILRDHSSFPSDTATLAAGLLTGIFLVSRKTGLIAAFYAAIFILLPRIYLGLHYPTDLVGGILIGTTSVVLANTGRIKNLTTKRLLGESKDHPQRFYMVAFLLTYEMANLFKNIRPIAEYSRMVLEKIPHRFF